MDIYGQIMDKVQKLTGALYRVTDLLSDREPLKWLLRNKAINIYENIASIIFAKNKENIIEETLNNFSQIISILELIPMTAFISNLNFEVLKREYVNLRALIEGKRTDISQEQKLLSDISIGQPSTRPPATPARLASQREAGRSSQAKSPARHSLRHQALAGGGAVEQHIGHIGHNGRKEKVFEFLRTEGPKTISEITPVFNGISEKTIQRDLLELVKSGKIRAEGEKRWRKYSIS